MMQDDARDAFANLSDADKAELKRLARGADYVQTARNQLARFSQSEGWRDGMLSDILRLIRTEVIVGES